MRRRALHGKRLLAFGLVTALAAPGCRCSSEPSSSAAAATAAIEALDCQRGSAQLTLSASAGGRESTASELEPGVELPFASEPGMAIAVPGQFFATGLRHESRGAIALLARLGMDDEPPQLIELGRVQGDVVPPRLAAVGSDLLVVLQQRTAGGRELRVGRIQGRDLGAAATWQEGPHQTSAESSAFDIAADAQGAVLVYDDWSASANHGRILAAAIPWGGEGAPRIEGRPISPPDVDAEAPRISLREGGFWLTWLVNGSGGGASGRVYDPGDETKERVAAGSAYGARWLSIAPLDALGRLTGTVRRITARAGRVVGYDLITGPSGSAWLTWRQDAPTPGASGGRVFLAEVSDDGTQEVRAIREDDVGAGEPTWLSAGASTPPWLTFPDGRDRTLLMRVTPGLRIGAPLRLGSELEGAGALAAIDERVLFALPRGRAIELVWASCVAPDASAARGADAGPSEALPRPVADAGPPGATGSQPP